MADIELVINVPEGMTREEIENTPELVDFLLDECVTAVTRMKLHKRLEELCKLAIEALEQTRWVPVSEKLPEVNQRVLVTSYGRVCYAMMTSADGNSGHPVFRLQDSLNERVVCETTVHSEFTTSRIIAWMPLPPSYQGE